MKNLLIEAYILLAWARVLKAIPFRRVSPFLGSKMSETSFEMDAANIKLVKQISHAIHIMSKYTFWESKCLVKAIASMKMLERRQIDCTLYLGTGKDENGEMIAHAWLRSGPLYLTGAEEMKKFVIVYTFAKKSRYLLNKE
ncbi:lasso peptide biosynthesis B2 protein [Bacillus sp. ISL-7]|uniref:lasso peptide biosynthesis B2 protein n=1 Tax=Bacillus sp. ISL-7 TaxID=2819136 RepID=UPI001BE8F8B5|nr:lasso peptide biosynthesis B2 protein [Bacillus sp. ISL-7]MBT2736757.1 lasso peptide biosynthesis B2 protein [Bacillus sp. ISL-7]